MKLVKKILRLLPLFFLLTMFLILIFNKGIFNGLDNSVDIQSYISNVYTGLMNTLFVTDFYRITSSSLVSPIYNWFMNNISRSVYIEYAIVVMFYELFLSLVFLFFDFINMIFGWANKLIDKGANSVD